MHGVSRGVVILFVLIVVFVTALTWMAERDSCLRHAESREVFNERAAVLRELAHEVNPGLVSRVGHVRTLDCSGLLPDK